jgi:hypothetical protein
MFVAGCDLGSAAVVHPAPGGLVEVVDVDGDGALDVVSSGPGAYQVLLNDRAGGLAGGPPVAVDGEVVAFDLGDLDGDGTVDRVDAHRPGSGPTTNLVLSRGDGAGGFGAPEVVATDVGSGLANDVEIGDYDGDGAGDLLVAGRYGAHVFRNDGTGTFADIDGALNGVPCVLRPGDYPFEATDVEVADRNGDGIADVVLVGHCLWPAGPSPHLVVMFGDGAGDFPSKSIRGVGGLGVALVGLSLADIDEDGYDDVVVAAPDVSAVAVFPGTSTGEVANPISVATPAPPGDVEVADIDADGHLDLVVTADGTGFARVLYGTGSGTFPESHAVATGGDVVGPVAVGDIDGDGSVDVVFGNDGDTPDSSVAVLRNTRDGRQH